MQYVSARSGCVLTWGACPPVELDVIAPPAIAPLLMFASGAASLKVAVTPAASMAGTPPTGVR